MKRPQAAARLTSKPKSDLFFFVREKQRFFAMKTFLSSVLFAVSILAVAASRADDRWNGVWTMTSMSLDVAVESWGENCGPRPVSYTSKQAREVEITAAGRHLIFSKGGMRTDRCGSPNPRLATVSQMTTSGVWSRTCQTENTDPKYEWGEYSLVAKGSDRLEYTAKSKFDWTLKGDHCVASSTEKRIYVRDLDASERARQERLEKENGNEEEEKINLDEVHPECAEPGETKRISVQPKDVRLGPGERVCFKVLAWDGNGCKKEVNASWSATQDFQSADELISKGGCFKAGDTAADSEGLYRVAAKADGKADFAEVTVVFPDLGELLAARLRPLDELPDADGGAAAATAPKLTLIPLQPSAGTSQPAAAEMSRSGWLWIAVAGVLAAAAIGAVLAVVLRRSKKTSDRHGPVERENNRIKEELSTSTPFRTEMGMVCPKCHRGYDSTARFCPHDSEKLLPFTEWRSTTRAVNKNT